MSAPRAIACGLLAAFAWACGPGDDAVAELRARRAESGVRAVVEDLMSEPGSVYDRASRELRASRERGSFIAGAEDLARVMGAFEGGVSVVSVDLTDTAEGRAGRVEAELSFERGTLVGSLSFLETDSGWKPLGIELPIPEGRREAWAAARASRNAGPAPDEAVRAASSILAALAAGETGAASDAAAAAAQRASRAFGAYDRVLSQRWARIDESGERVRISAVLAYDSAWARAEIALRRDPAGKGGYRLESLRVFEPDVPGKPL